VDPVGLLLAEQAAVGLEGNSADAFPGGEAGEQGLGKGLAASRLDQRRRESGREDGAGGHDAAELLKDDDELGQAEPGAAVGVVDVESEPALVRELVPEGRAGPGGGVEQRPRHARRAVALAPAADGVVEREMVLGNADRHAVILGTD